MPPCSPAYHLLSRWCLSQLIIECLVSRVIRSMSQGAGNRKQREKRRFIAYSIYAWGLPSLLTAITAVVDVLDLSPATLKPDMGVHYCWFSST